MEYTSINTVVVQALMNMRGLSSKDLAIVLQAREADVRAWVAGAEDAPLTQRRQLEVLALLGVGGDALRGDIVHHWRVREPFFGSPAKVYADLHILTEAFGKAEVVFLARKDDPMFSFTARAFFGLKFPTFYAVLEIEGSSLLNHKFSPAVSSGLRWMEGTTGLLMDADKYKLIEPGAIHPEDMDEQVNQVTLALQWEKLALTAKESNITAEQLGFVVQQAVSRNIALPSMDDTKRDVVKELGISATQVPAPDFAAPAKEAAAQPVREPVASKPVPPAPRVEQPVAQEKAPAPRKDPVVKKQASSSFQFVS